MKRELTFKTILITASLLSLFAFAFVNLSVNTPLSQHLAKVGITQSRVESEDAGESREISVPDVTVLGRLWEIAQHFLEREN